MDKMFDKIFHYNEYNRNKFIQSISDTVPAGAKVLDAGAGPCTYKSLFTHCDYKAQDFAAYEGDDHQYGELDYISDIADIPVGDGSFDVIICTEVFEHVPNPGLVVKEFSRILREGGKLIITAPLGSGIHMAPYHFYGGFSPYWYIYNFEKYGFEPESIRPNGGYFKLYGQESQRFLTMLTPATRWRKMLFFPLKAVLAIWFRLIMPVICHYLDNLDKEKEFTAGYFVVATRTKR